MHSAFWGSLTEEGYNLQEIDPIGLEKMEMESTKIKFHVPDKLTEL